MITNERQYRITKATAEKFRQALADLRDAGVDQGNLHPILVKGRRDALQSQLQDLDDEIAEYEALKSGQVGVISTKSFDELAIALIKARIAAGLNQRTLSERLGLKEQQIQRYEQERYASASYRRLQEVADALGVHIRDEVVLPRPEASLSDLFSKLRRVGLREQFVKQRLLPTWISAQIDHGPNGRDEQTLATKAAADLSRIFGWSMQELLGDQELTMPRFAAAEARFKMPARRAKDQISLYTAYANHLAIIVLEGARNLPRERIPTDARIFRSMIIERYKTLNLASALHFAWDLGVPVLPLRDPGGFHGACWRYEGRNLIVLKQKSPHEARWLFDLIHELFHAGRRPEETALEVIESDETSDERRHSEEEIEASQFAGDVVLDGEAEKLAQKCVKRARGNVERLKRVVPQVAEEEGVAIGNLANYMAFRLSWQDINWWGAAANLQKDDADPWQLAKDVFFERFPFDLKSGTELNLLSQALN